jgi:hypothetical protein
MAGWGGRRPGAGAKKKAERIREMTGQVLAHPSSAGINTAPPPVEEFDAPDDLTMDERRVWLELAPHAFAARTLTKATALGFRMMCRNIVLERQLAESAERATASHRGLIQRIDAELLRFSLAPCGKPMEVAAPHQAAPVSPLQRFLKKA